MSSRFDGTVIEGSYLNIVGHRPTGAFDLTR
jgi:hypothetical protein